MILAALTTKNLSIHDGKYGPIDNVLHLVDLSSDAGSGECLLLPNTVGPKCDTVASPLTHKNVIIHNEQMLMGSYDFFGEVKGEVEPPVQHQSYARF